MEKINSKKFENFQSDKLDRLNLVLGGDTMNTTFGNGCTDIATTTNQPNGDKPIDSVRETNNAGWLRITEHEKHALFLTYKYENYTHSMCFVIL